MNDWIIRCMKSKTMLFNAIVASLAALEGVFNLLQPHMDGNVYAWVSIVLVTGNAFLRTRTTEPLKNK
jgi:hypothetical protein